MGLAAERMASPAKGLPLVTVARSMGIAVQVTLIAKPAAMERLGLALVPRLLRQPHAQRRAQAQLLLLLLCPPGQTLLSSVWMERMFLTR